jgi:NADPH-dependent curcumin reductase CurA
VTREVTLEQLSAVFDTMLAGESFGRTVVKL